MYQCYNPATDRISYCGGIQHALESAVELIAIVVLVYAVWRACQWVTRGTAQRQ